MLSLQIEIGTDSNRPIHVEIQINEGVSTIDIDDFERTAVDDLGPMGSTPQGTPRANQQQPIPPGAPMKKRRTPDTPDTPTTPTTPKTPKTPKTRMSY
jgi:hypothetical protein